jgi:hypothetical protein
MHFGSFAAGGAINPETAVAGEENPRDARW